MINFRSPPYIIYHKRFVGLQTIRFEGKDGRDFESTVDAPVPGVQESGTNVFMSRKFLDNNYLAAIVFGTGTYAINVSDNGYQLEGKIIFRTVSDSRNENLSALPI